MVLCHYACADPGILVRGGVQVSLTKKALTTFFFFSFFSFSPQLILQKSNGQFQRNLSFFKVPERVQHFPGGANCLFPVETHITCDFPGVPDPLFPLLDPHLIMYATFYRRRNVSRKSVSYWWFFVFLHDVISLPDAISYDKNVLIRRKKTKQECVYIVYMHMCTYQ